MAKDRESITTNGRAAFYAAIWPDIMKVAHDCGWALGLHGSLASDMDIMAMPWTADAESVESMILAISECFAGNPRQDYHAIPFRGKPHGRVVYTIGIWADWYLDINVIEVQTGQEG